MPKLFKTFSIAVLACLSTTITHAESPHTPSSMASIGYQTIDISNASLGSLVGRYTHRYNDFLGAEIEASLGVVDDTQDFLGTNIEISQTYGIGVAGIGSYPIGENGSYVFIRVGYGSVGIEAEGAGTSANGDADGFLYGIGANIMVLGPHGVRLDYTSFEGDADQYAVSYARQF